MLLVDDEALVREITAQGLEGAGYRVLSVGTAAEALDLLDAGEAVDVLVSDLSMPGMNGLALIREAQARRSGLPGRWCSEAPGAGPGHRRRLSRTL